MLEKCVVVKSKQKIFTASEDGKTYTLNNNSSYVVAKVQIDGCVFKDDEIKCDWLFIAEDQLSIFVELKGSDIEKGLTQLLATYDKLKNENEIKNNLIWFRICIGEKNSVPRGLINNNKAYRKLFLISNQNILIRKQSSDSI